MQHAEKQSLNGALFEGLSEDTRSRVAARCEWRYFSADAVMLRQGDASDEVMFVQSGMARAKSYAADGGQVVYRDIRPGDVIGDFSAIDGSPRSSYVVAIEPTWTAILPGKEFWALMEAHPEFLRAQMRHMTSVLREMTARIFELITRADNARLQLYLMNRVRRMGTTESQVWLDDLPALEDIAQTIGAAPAGLAQEFERLEATGILKRGVGGSLKLNVLRLERDMMENDKG